MLDSMRRNVTVLALAQIGVLVTGIIGAGISARRLAELGAQNAGYAMWMRNYGFVLVAIPLLWFCAAICLCRTDFTSARRDVAVFVSGLALLAALAWAAFKATVVAYLLSFGAH